MLCAALAFLSCACALAQEVKVLSDFETSPTAGWYVAEEPKGVVTRTAAPDAAVGEGAVRFSYGQPKGWSYGYPETVLREGRQPVGFNALSFWIKGDGSDETIGGAFVENDFKAYHTFGPLSLQDTDWRKVTIRFAHLTPPLTAKAAGDIMTLRFTKSGSWQPFSFCLDQVQYEKLPEVELEPPTINSLAPQGVVLDDPNPAITASFRDTGASGVDPSSAVITFDGADVTQLCEISPAGFRYLPMAPPLQGVWHTVTARVTDKAGNVSETVRWDIDYGKVLPEKVTLNGSECVRVNGEPFFPIGLYSAGEAQMHEVAAAGFNTVHSYHFEGVRGDDDAKQYLDCAYKNGLRVFMGLYRPSVRKRELEGAKARMAWLDRHPALLTWYMADEPDCWKEEGMPAMQAAYPLVHETAKLHPACLVVCHYSAPPQYKDLTDILMIDYYPVPSLPKGWYDGLWGVHKIIKIGVDALVGRKPIWFVVQANKKPVPKGNDLDPEAFRHPTFTEMRCMTYLAIISGAKGIIYYSLKDALSSPEGKTWEDLKVLGRELHSLYPLLTTAGMGRQDEVEGSSVMFMEKRTHRGWYLIAVNHADHAQEATIGGLATDNARASVVSERRKVSIEGGKLTDRFGPYEVHIYHVPAAD